MTTRTLDRDAARNANFVLVASDRMAVRAARSAASETGKQPRGRSAGTSRRVAPWLFSTLALGSVLGFTAGCTATPKAETAATPVRAQRVKPATADRGVRYSAQIIPVEQVSVAFKTSGYVMDLLQVRDSSGRMRDLEEGDAVGAGAILARVEERDYQSKVARAGSVAR